MWEQEKATGEEGELVSLFRSTNYLSLSWHIDRRSSFGITGYMQPAVRDFNDRRALLDATLGFSLNGWLGWNSTLRYRHDSEPPPGLRSFDLELANGVTATF
jgi:hypothetical protein